MTGALSRRAGLGGGSVVGGRLGLLVDPGLLSALSARRQVALVSGTNGKTTTTRLLAAALGTSGPVATSRAGSNLPAGIVAALAQAPRTAIAVLEVDEGYLPGVLEDTAAEVVVLLNLSRDQLDRVSEVRMIAKRWRAALAAREPIVVANADDPLVVWAASGSRRVTWVGAGSKWTADAIGCPACGGRVMFEAATWSCLCGYSRPVPHWWLDGSALEGSKREAAGSKGEAQPLELSLPVELSLPGRFNRANAAMAAVAAGYFGVPVDKALAAMAGVSEVEGRFATVDLGGRVLRTLLAKNPAGWTEILEVLEDARAPIVVGINARVADGKDPSWLWDVPFERLAGHAVVASGERCLDLAVRLRHAGVAHEVVADQSKALQAALEQVGGDAAGEVVHYVGNYTAFQQLRAYLRAPQHDRVPVAPEARPVPVAPSVEARTGRPPRSSVLQVVAVLPDLLGTYGDVGNAIVLANRARWRGIDAEVVLASSARPLPETGDIYCIGGGEDAPQVEAAALLARSGTLERAVDRGAVLLAVCAGFQIVGRSFPGADGTMTPGLGLVDVTTAKGPGRRAVGELLVEPCPRALPALAAPATPRIGAIASDRPDATLGRRASLRTCLTGFENHAGVTSLGEGCVPLGRVIAGRGNGVGDSTEGAVIGRVVCTYLHGPVLARNALMADWLLQMACGTELGNIADSEADALHAERVRAALSGRRDLVEAAARVLRR